ncbi:hypothetical protein EDC19_1330 [Natranaerovirga hydrolytica]|uniref:Transposase n=1 Tax=Natranaerovirga hydrolytica TaxID=680378 RepID=A0A4R1MRF1_9FIRM|nr:hypothetical protein [Natranaerovirga hydrolytica]TCK93149.1 hypothetical protein EDC19_1330 [Natranaerovirga hydrolytica]
MSKNHKEIDWDKVIKLFNKYPGTIKSFCNEQEISTHQLYYQRKKNELLDKSPIKIQIDKAILHIENRIDENNFSTIVKVLAASC